MIQITTVINTLTAITTITTLITLTVTITSKLVTKSMLTLDWLQQNYKFKTTMITLTDTTGMDGIPVEIDDRKYTH